MFWTAADLWVWLKSVNVEMGTAKSITDVTGVDANINDGVTFHFVAAAKIKKKKTKAKTRIRIRKEIQSGNIK